MSGARFPQGYVSQQVAPFSLPITANGVYAGAQIDSGLVGINELAARVTVKLTTNTAAVNFQWQVLIAGTWVTVLNNAAPAPVTIQTGTGSAVTTTYYICAPPGIVAGSLPARIVFNTSGTAGAGGTTDIITGSYDFRSVTYGAL